MLRLLAMEDEEKDVFGVETINSSIDYNEKARTERVGLSIAGKRAGSINRSR